MSHDSSLSGIGSGQSNLDNNSLDNQVNISTSAQVASYENEQTEANSLTAHGYQEPTQSSPQNTDFMEGDLAPAKQTAGAASEQPESTESDAVINETPQKKAISEAETLAKSAQTILNFVGKSAETVGKSAGELLKVPFKVLMTDGNKEKRDEKDKAQSHVTKEKTPELNSRTIYTIKTLDSIKLSSQNINLAMVGSFHGHFRIYAEIIQAAIIAHFNEVNKAGGIDGKMLNLISCEDNADPTLSKKLVSRLANTHNVTLFIGNMGTRGILKTLPLIESKKIALLFPWGGSQELNNKNLSNLVMGLGTIKPQLERIADYCINGLQHRKVGIFFSDGNFSTQAKNDLLIILKTMGITPVAIASYNRYTMDIHTPARTLMRHDPKVIISLGSSKPTSKLISRFFEMGYYGTTFIGIDSTLFVPDILRTKGAEYSYASTMPNPTTSIIPLAQQYRDAMEGSFPDELINSLSFSYYFHAKILTEALKKAPLPYTNAHIIREIEKMKSFDLGGVTVDFNAETRHAYPHLIKIITEG